MFAGFIYSSFPFEDDDSVSLDYVHDGVVVETQTVGDDGLCMITFLIYTDNDLVKIAYSVKIE